MPAVGLAGSCRLLRLRPPQPWALRVGQRSRLPATRLLAPFLLVIGCMGTQVAVASATEEAASKYNIEGVRHEEKCIKTKSGGAVTMRDAEGHALQNAGGIVTSRPEQRERCASEQEVGVEVNGLESVAAGGVTSYYSWPGAPNGYQNEGFIVASELASRPSLLSSGDAGNGKAASDAPGSPAYRVTPVAIDSAQEYYGKRSEKWYRYSPYGQPTGGAQYTLMTWSWVNVNEGGIARATVAAGATFYPSNVQPITLDTNAGEGGPVDGLVTVRYGRVSTGSGSLYGWMVTRVTYEGDCVDHMEYVGGGAALGNTLCEGPQAPSALYDASSGQSIFFANLSSALPQWWVNGGASEEVELGTVSGGSSNAGQ
jgi:hypothetical protein